MVNPLAPLLADGVIDEVVGRLKSGKEADLWLVRHGGELIAAKVYKAPHERSFKNRVAYQEGRQVRNTRTQRAMSRGSGFGRQAEEDAWKTKEADALHALHAAGVRVPRPVLFYEGVLLMELVVDAAGHPAPRLIDAQVAGDQAASLYADLRGQAIRMLTCDLIHGDLSPYNVLMGAQGPVVIDFPQVVGAAHNSQAEKFFRRDLENLRRHFATLDPGLGRAAGDGEAIWRAYVRRELSGDFVPPARAAEPARQGQRQERVTGLGHRQGDGRRGHGEPQAATAPHAGSAHRQASQPASQQAGHPGGQHRRHDAGGKPQSAARAPQARPHDQPRQPEPPRRQGGRGGQRPPQPEVVRVVRPPLGQPAPSPQHRHAATAPPPQAPHAPHTRAPQGAPKPHPQGAASTGGVVSSGEAGPAAPGSGRRRRRRRRR